MKRSRNQTIELRSKPFRTAMYLLGSVAFVAIGIWQVTRDPSQLPASPRPDDDWLSPWMGIYFFGACALVFAYELLDRRPKLLIGPAGIIWGRWRKTEYPWTEISSVEIKTQVIRFKLSRTTMKYLILRLRNPHAHPSQGVKGWLARMSQRMGYGAIAIPITDLDGPPEVILAAVEDLRQGAE